MIFYALIVMNSCYARIQVEVSLGYRTRGSTDTFASKAISKFTKIYYKMP